MDVLKGMVVILLVCYLALGPIFTVLVGFLMALIGGVWYLLAHNSGKKNLPNESLDKNEKAAPVLNDSLILIIPKKLYRLELILTTSSGIDPNLSIYK